MTERTRFGFFVITFHRAFGHITLNHGNQFFRPFGVNGTCRNGYDTMAVFSVKTNHVFPVLINPYGNLQFIAIGIRKIPSALFANVLAPYNTLISVIAPVLLSMKYIILPSGVKAQAPSS